MNQKPIEILLVEDEPADIILTREALKESKIRTNLNVVNDGIEALDYLYKKGEHANATRPDLILLDLKLPKKNGFEVLKEIKQNAALKCIPVVVLTTVEGAEEVNKIYNLDGNCYVTKPLDLDKFSDVVRTIEDFWFTVAKLPPREM